MKALVFSNKLEMVDYPVPKITDDEALVKISLAGICNTDREIMKGYKDFHGVLGHEWVGKVEKAADKSLIGERVVGSINIGCGKCKYCLSGMEKHCPDRTCIGITGHDGCFAEYLSIPLKNLYKVDSDISDEEALFTEPLAAAISAVKDASVKENESVLIMGDGRLAYLIYLGLIYFAPNVKNITVKGKHLEKLSNFTSAEKILSFSDDREYDVIFEATGSDSGMEEALSHVSRRGRVIVKTTRAGKCEMDLNKIVVNEIKLIGSRCGNFKDALYVLKQHPYLPQTMFFPLEDYLTAFSIPSSIAFKVGFKIATI